MYVRKCACMPACVWGSGGLTMLGATGQYELVREMDPRATLMRASSKRFCFFGTGQKIAVSGEDRERRKVPGPGSYQLSMTGPTTHRCNLASGPPRLDGLHAISKVPGPGAAGGQLLPSVLPVFTASRFLLHTRASLLLLRPSLSSSRCLSPSLGREGEGEGERKRRERERKGR